MDVPTVLNTKDRLGVENWMEDRSWERQDGQHQGRQGPRGHPVVQEDHWEKLRTLGSAHPNGGCGPSIELGVLDWERQTYGDG
jgi:hypothetical protein